MKRKESTIRFRVKCIFAKHGLKRQARKGWRSSQYISGKI